MKMVFSSPDTAELELLKNVLLKAGIRAVEVNQQLSQVLPSVPFQAELWVEEVDYTEAAALMAEWQKPSATGTPWVCPRCGEKLENQFSKCWKCGTRRDAVE